MNVLKLDRFFKAVICHFLSCPGNPVRQLRPLFHVKISARDLFLNFCYFPPHFFFAVPPHSPATLLLPSEVSKEAEGRSANPVGQPTLFQVVAGGHHVFPCRPMSYRAQSDRQIHIQNPMCFKVVSAFIVLDRDRYIDTFFGLSRLVLRYRT